MKKKKKRFYRLIAREAPFLRLTDKYDTDKRPFNRIFKEAYYGSTASEKSSNLTSNCRIVTNEIAKIQKKRKCLASEITSRSATADSKNSSRDA